MTRTATTKGNGKGRRRGDLTDTVAAAAVAAAARGFEEGIDAFTRIAEGRVNGIIKKLNTLSKLASGKSKYGYSDADVEAIRRALVAAVNKSCDRLLRAPVQSGFKLRREAAERENQ